jgi:DNA invertase Pin-like site-specific DNA recombinase
MAHRKPRKKAGNATVRLVGYCRVSIEEQAERGVSLDAQRERLAAYATAHGHELVGVEEDAGISGKVSPDQRPGLACALKLVRDGEADGLVVLKLDRLSRSTRDILDLVDETGTRAGWRLVSVSENLDTATAAGRLVITVLAALSQMEREQIGERTRFALAAILRKGRGRSRFTPFGWRTSDGSTENRGGDRSELVPHTEEQAAMCRIVNHREQGKGARRIAAALNRQGPNPRSGKSWTPESVAAILRRLDRWESAGVNPLAA